MMELTIEQVEEYWEWATKEHPHHFIISEPKSSDENWFFGEKARESKKFVMDKVAPDGKQKILEIGCGIGRIMFAMAEDFEEVHGVDISSEFIRLGEEYALKFEKGNCFFYKGNGLKLDMFQDETFDFVYSYIAFQHFPYVDMVLSYIRETYRVLKPGGIFKFHHNRLKDGPNEGDIGFGCSLSETDIATISEDLGFVVKDSYPGEFYECYHRGWWTILEKN